MKFLFGLTVIYFQLLECILQVLQAVLTPVDNLKRLLRPPIFDKTRLVTFTVQQRNCNDWFLPEREKREWL